MNKKKGFTLIELLAIIVILAIIAVITVPLILNIINDAQKNASIDSAYGYKSALEKYYMKKVVENTENELPNGYKNISELPEDFIVSGESPSEGWVKLKKGIVEEYSLKYNDYVVTKFKDKDIKVSKRDTVANIVQIPDAYQEVEYLESTGTQYIDTGVLGNNTIGYDLNVKVNKYGSELGIFAVSSSANGPHYVLQAHGEALKLYLTGDNGAINVATYQNDNNFHKVEYNKNNDYSIYFDKNNLGVSSITNTPEIPYSFNIFSRKYGNTSNKFSEASIKYLKIYDSGALVRDFVPVIRKSDNKPGMLDLANLSNNLCNPNNYSSYTISPEGTNTDGEDRFSTDYINAKQNTEYTLSFQSTFFATDRNNKVSFYGIAFFDKDKAFLSRVFSNSNTTISGTAPENTVYMKAFAQPVNGTQFTKDLFDAYKIMLNEGSTPLPYEPYGYKFYTNAGTGEFITGPEI